MGIQLIRGDALLIVDTQNDFLPSCSLAVSNGNAIIPVLNRYIAHFLEYRLPMLAAQVPIDGFGTSLDISIDTPTSDRAYKLQEYAGILQRKHSEGKTTWPSRKQVHRQYDANDCLQSDTIALEQGDPQPGEPLIQPFMHVGRRMQPKPSLHALRSRTLTGYQRLPAAMTGLESAPAYPVTISNALKALAVQIERQYFPEA
jgi:nicotinate phosphoribosyltransferase